MSGILGAAFVTFFSSSSSSFFVVTVGALGKEGWQNERVENREWRSE